MARHLKNLDEFKNTNKPIFGKMRNVYMNRLRFNIALDRDVGEKLKKIKNKSRFINDALREKISRSEEQKKNNSLRRSYIESIQQDIEMAQEWNSTAGDAL